MIDDTTRQRILDTANIYEVISDFVSLKKRGANYLGCCPFHNEKTPSFSVSPSKGIYKCFGCGRGGNVVNFIMEHEQMSYVDALKYLANKYNIPIEEKELTPEQKKAQGERESMLLLIKYAADFFSYQLNKTEEGRTIGLSYFKYRSVSDESIKEFGLGYSPEKWDALVHAATEKGFKQEFLISTGLVINSEKGLFDRFRTRVIFPIHDIAGKVIGFGGRTMAANKNIAKYLNSPESLIYHKSNTLYGIYQAKRAITQMDRCYLVEGYLDVISMHARGIKNVVASSGTSLTVEQIRLIRRLTSNVTIIYDGDSAGIKASLRGIDLVLEEGLNVKVVPLPAEDDPDTFALHHTKDEIESYIQKNEIDFISFKTQLLLEHAQTDPIERARLTNDIVESISKIPDGITRALYIREASEQMRVDETLLYAEMTKKRIALTSKRPQHGQEQAVQQPSTRIVSEYQEDERMLIRYLLLYGRVELFTEVNEGITKSISVAAFIIEELTVDGLKLIDPILHRIFEEYAVHYKDQTFIADKYFINHSDAKVSSVVASIICDPYELSKIWNVSGTTQLSEENSLKTMVPKMIDTYRMKRLVAMTNEITAKILEMQSDTTGAVMELIKKKNDLDKIRLALNERLRQTGIY